MTTLDRTTVTAGRDAWCAARFAEQSDQDLSYATVALDQRIMEHDAYCCCDYRYDAGDCDYGPPSTVNFCMGDERRILAAMTYEGERRCRLGIEVSKPWDTTLEERLGPYGEEWQLEQRDRMEGRG